MALWFACLLVVGAAEISQVTLNNGVKMPMLSLEPEKYPAQQITEIVKLGLETGINSIDAAANNQCQQSVGAALQGVERNSYFLTSALQLDANISASSANALATESLQSTLSALGVDHVDLMLLCPYYRPPYYQSCEAIQEQWRALEDFYAAGKARAIGTRVYCPSTLQCLLQTAKVAPAVNQIFYHVGMGSDPDGYIAAFNASGAVTQSVRSLDSGNHELINGSLVSSIGKAHDWSGAQVSMRWVLDHGVSLSLPTSSQSHMREAVAIFEDHLTHDEMKKLDSAKSPQDSPTFGPCPRADSLIV